MEAAPIDARSMVSVLVGSTRVSAMAEGYFRAAPGDPVTLSLAARPSGVFTAEGTRID
jgi:iron(III) transport system ATP-binding protein